MRFEVVDVTKSMAANWLARNVKNNRGPKRKKISAYKQDMTHVPSRWLITGDTIKITADGDMIDGGQRMRAAREAMEENPDLKSVRMAVAFNVPYEAIYVTDKGAARTFADNLRIEEGTVNQNPAGAIVRRVYIWQQGNPADARGSNSAFVDPTDTEMLEFYRKHRSELDAATARGMDLKNKKIGNTTAAGTAFFVLREIDDPGTWAFFDHLITGADLPARSPILVLRERLLRAGQAVGRNRRARVTDVLTATEQIYFYIRAWNAYRTDEQIDRLILPSRGITNANFPKPE